MTAPLLHARFPELRATLPHIALGARPTPVRALPELDAALWVKDDGAFGDGGWGGNKVRKLEWLLPDSLRRGRRTIVTAGGLGTNWGLAAALYGREHGLSTTLALVDQPLDDHVRAQLGRLRASGATLHRTRTKRRTVALAPLLLAGCAIRDRGRLPYLLPAGGSSPVGALGAVETALELAAQVDDGALPAPSHVVCAVGSGGTAAGLLLGLALAGLPARVVAVVVNDTLRLDAPALVRLARRGERLLRRRGARLPHLTLDPGGLLVTRDWLGPAYGHATAAGERARALARERTGLALDPVYTGKAMAALLALCAAGRLGDGPLLYLHTDGPRPHANPSG